MTTSSRKNYNVLALRGADVDDMELVENFNMPEEYAYTPKVIEFMADREYQRNIDKGMDVKQATMYKKAAIDNSMKLLKK